MHLQNDSPKPRILYVEDDGDIREMMIVLLSHEGFVVSVAGTGKDALHQAQSNVFDLLLIDHQLPDFSGLEFCRRLRQVDAKTPILFFSGSTQEKDRQAALDAGAQGYLVKPADILQIAKEIRRVLKARGQLSLREASPPKRKRVSDQLEA